MRVLQVLPDLSAGGAEGFVTNLGVSLADLGAEVKFLLMAGVRGVRGQMLFSLLRKAGIEVVGAEEHNVRSPMNLMRLMSLIRSWQPDIVQANLYPAEVICAATKLLSVGREIRFIRRLANTDQNGYRSVRIARRLARLFDVTIANSPAVADSYTSFMKNPLNGALVTIPNGAHLLEAIPAGGERAHARYVLGIGAEAFVVAHIGRMYPGKSLDGGLKDAQKGHDALLEAFARAFSDREDCIMLCVGNGPLRPEAEQLSRSLGLNGKVRFPGELAEPWTVLKAADVFCFPSRYEGLPNALIEAASCGLPVVTSDIPEIRDLSSGDAWLLKPVDDVEAFADGLSTVYKAQAMFNQLARDAAPGFRQRFCMGTCAKKYLDTYESARSSVRKPCFRF